MIKGEIDTKLEGIVCVVRAPKVRARKARSDWGRMMKVALLGLGILMILGYLPVWAQSGDPELKQSLQSETIWVNDIGSGFHKGLLQVGGTIGAGFGTRRPFRTHLIHDLALGSTNLGWVFTDVMAPDKFYRGNLELLIELFDGLQFHPDGRYFVGLTPLIRYNFATGSRWVLFVDAGAGVSCTDIDGPDLTGKFQFNIQVGVGTHYFLTDRTALTVQYRWLHFSDAGIRRPNPGTNTQMFHIGMSWFF